MTDLDTAKIMGKSDALEISHEISKLTERMSKLHERLATEPFDHSSFRGEIQQIMSQTMKIMSPDFEDFFNQPDNRMAYYRSFEEQMRQVGLLQPDVSYAPQSKVVHQ